ncbi:MAG: hypothetical protein BGO31_14165 [Bacteroidetes bacterium 43-16]|nr:MAG: hypothetical protein BGO31_14165 [Bacteroidetes bacterium 43-16]
MRKFTPYTVFLLPHPATPGFDVDGLYFVALPDNKMTIYIRDKDNTEWISLTETDLTAYFTKTESDQRFVTYTNANADIDLNNKDLVNVRKIGINLTTPATINYGDLYYYDNGLKLKVNTNNTFGEWRKVTGLSPDLSWTMYWTMPNYTSTNFTDLGLAPDGINKAALVVFPYMYLQPVSSIFGGGYHTDMAAAGTLISGDHTNSGASSRSHIYFDHQGNLYAGASGQYAYNGWNKVWTEMYLSASKVTLLNTIIAETYTPVLIIVAESPSVVVKNSFYTRVGDFVDLAITVEVSNLTLNVPNIFTLSLPVISSFTTQHSVPVIGFEGSNRNYSTVTVYKNTVDKVHVQINPPNTMPYTVHVHLKYRL